MQAEPGNVLTESEAIAFAKQGTTATVEVRGRLTSARILRDLIAGFAHHEGGTIIFGYNPRRGKVVGCNQTRLMRRCDDARSQLGSACVFTTHFYKVNRRKILAAICVPKQLIPEVPVIRVGHQVRTMTRQQALDMLRRLKIDTTPEILASMIVVLMEKLRVAEKRAEDAESVWRKIRDAAIGAVVTGLIGYVSGLIRFTKLLS